MRQHDCKGQGHLDRGSRRPALHGLPRQLGAPHRVCPSAPRRRHQAAARRAELLAAPFHQRGVSGTGRAAGQAGAGRPEPRAVHHRRVRCGGGGAEDRPCRDGPVQDTVVLGCVSRGRLRRIVGWRRGHVSLAHCRAADAGGRARGAVCLLSLPVRPSRAGQLRARLRQHGRVRAGARGRRGRRDRRADARRPAGTAAWLLEEGARGLQPAWRAAHT